ncbi:hypothetical protein ACFE04_005575 [Oxalis oulophora]
MKYSILGKFARDLLVISWNLIRALLEMETALPPRRPRKNFQWQNDLLEESIRASGIPGIDVGTKLFVSNLDFGVTNEDIRELFSEIGEMKRFAIHYDKNGRPSGSADIIYARRSDAVAALKKYNNVLLDGRPMKIEIFGASAEMPVTARRDMPFTTRVNVTGLNNGRRKRTVVMTPNVGGPRGPAANNHGFGQRRRGGGRDRGGPARGGRGFNGRGGRKKPVEKSAADLDKELEKYHSESMQT